MCNAMFMWGASSLCIYASLIQTWECFGHVAVCRLFWQRTFTYGKNLPAATSSWDGECQSPGFNGAQSPAQGVHSGCAPCCRQQPKHDQTLSLLSLCLLSAGREALKIGGVTCGFTHVSGWGSWTWDSSLLHLCLNISWVSSSLSPF